MHPKRRPFVPLLFILSFAAIFLYSYHYHSSIQNPNPIPNIDPKPKPKSSNFSFSIKLLAFDRAASIRRCLRSLAAADYAGDRVHLDIFVDHFPVSADLESPGADLDIKLDRSHRILDLIDGFEWHHGEKRVHYRTGNAGLQAQWLEAWWPASDDEFAFVVEDDLEVSPLYYMFLKGLIMRYCYDRSNYSPWIYGASLQRPRFVAGKHGNKLQVDKEARLFLYQLVGTWGQLLFPKPWKEFRLWYDIHKVKGIKPMLQGMVSTGWYKRMGERIWTPWFIKFIQSRGYFNIYTNFLHERALSVSHRDAGVNYGKSAGPDSYLINASSLDFNLLDMQPLMELKWYDFCFREVLPGRVARSLDDLGSIIASFPKQKAIILISLYRTTKRTARNLLCHLERLGILNYILIGGSSPLLNDLARKGHAVIDVNQMFNSIRSYKLSETETYKEIWVKANVIKRVLESGFDCWVVDGNIIPVSNFLPDLQNSSHDFLVSERVELMLVKSSQTSVTTWVDDVISKVSMMVRDPVSADHSNFMYFLTKALKENAQVKVQKLDELGLGVKLGTGAANHSALESGKKMIFWPSQTELDLIQKELQRMGMWLIDDDSSCTAVVCHGQ